MNNKEQTLSIIKPDAVERNLVRADKKYIYKNNSQLKIVKKFKLQKMKPLNFIKFTNLNLSIMNYVLIFLQGP